MLTFDVVVIGAGQAGIEAALASARMGRRTLCVTLRLDRIGHLPCNCSIGGPAKGHLAREVDALGGQMGVTTDHALTHIRRVGTGKGPAVQTFRAHVCKTLYPALMREVLEGQENLTLMEASAEWVLHDDAGVTGLRVVPVGGGDAVEIACKALVMTTGTFLNGLCHEGRKKTVAAREGDQASVGLSAYLASIGVRLRRFKTGTTPRVRFSSLNLDLALAMESEDDAGPVSFRHDRTFPRAALLPCWQTHTNAHTHAILRENLGESAMFSGQIQGVGPRYCPSVEDKIVRFADKDSHPIFLEKEEWDSESTYVQGFSTSMPAEVQLAALRTIPGMEQVEMLRPGYAVEYDMADPLQLESDLMSRQMPGLFLAGQLNGTSGYEEAAAQGLVAGINAARFATGDAPVLFGRDTSFIGVMIDDLVTKGVEDPYRMLTARAEHRLLLRHDNADQRLTPIGREVGLVDDERWDRFQSKMRQFDGAMAWLRGNGLTPARNDLVEALPSAPLTNKASFFDLLRRPEVRLEHIEGIATELGLGAEDLRVPATVREQVEIAAAYDGYIEVQQRNVEMNQKLEAMRIPDDFEWESLKGLSYESLEKLGRLKPRTVGQAGRIPGVRPSDVALLIGHLKAQRPEPTPA